MELQTSWLKITLLSLFFAVASMAVEPAWASGLVLKSQEMTALNRILNAGDLLHRSLVAQNEDQIEIGIRDLINQIDQARQLSAALKAHERGHLLLVLDAAREQFDQTQTAFGEERVSRLIDGFNQLANLVRVYQVERSYGIFFCPDDKTSWVQKGYHGQNPFHPKSMLNCGIRVVNRN